MSSSGYLLAVSTRRTFVFFACVLAGAPLCLAQSNQAQGSLLLREFRRAYGVKSVIRTSPDGSRIISATGMVTRIYQAKPGEAARQFLGESRNLFGLKADLSDLRVLSEKTTLGGGHVEFQQIYGGLPIENARIQVNLDRDGRVLQVVSSYTPARAVTDQPALTREQASEAAITEFLRTTPPQPRSMLEKRPAPFTPLARSELQLKEPTKVDDIFYVAGDRLVRAYRVTVNARRPFGLKDIVIDAVSGAVLNVTDRIQNFDDGTGQVFVPNPNVSQNNNGINVGNVTNTNPNPYFTMPLLNLNPPSGGQYVLRGPFSVLMDLESPANTPPSEATGNFLYQRTDTGFVDVMVYYHIDRIQRYLQSLGFVDANNRQIRADAHAFSDGCNAFYSNSPVGAGDLTFGKCTARIAEDAHVIAHEYGHAIQDNQTNGKYTGSGYPRAMGEGFGDYMSFSIYNAEAVVSGYDQPCVGAWAANNGNCTRRVDDNVTADNYIVGGDEHDNGPIWSRTLWDIFNSLGKTTADRLIIQSHFNVPASPTFKDGADAIMTADLQLYYGSHLPQLCTVFKNRKIYQDADCPVLPPSTGTQTTLVVLAKFNDAGLPASPMTYADVNTKITDINAYLADVTYGQASLGNPTIKGWLDLGQSRAHYYDAASGNVLMDLVPDALDKVHAADATLDLTTFDRMIIITNDDGSGGETRGQMEWATTGPWPYDLPGLLGKKRLSVSVHTYQQTLGQFNHAMGHHFGLLDLYAHEGVAFPRKYADGWSNMAKDLTGAFNNVHFFGWDKLRPSWLTNTNVTFIPRPAAGGHFEQTYPIYRQEQNTSPQVLLQVGTTNGVTQRSNERVSYYIEARKKTGTYDGSIPSDGVLIYYVNEDIAQGYGPLRLVNASPAVADLTSAAFQPGGVSSVTNIDGSGLTVEVLPATGTEDYRVHITYDPPATQVDVWINPHDENWKSADIWVDSPNCNLGTCGFDKDNARTEVDRGDKPAPGAVNRAYARVYNHGPATAHNVRVDFWFSDPYHGLDGGAFDPDTGGNVAFNKHAFAVIADLPPGDAGVPVYVEWTPETPTSGSNVHSCIKVKIAQVTDDTNPANQASQENITEYDITSHSPYPPVVSAFRVANPYDHPILTYFRADNVPAGWTAEVVPKKAYLPVGGSVDAQVTIQAPLTYPVCSTEFVKVTGWYPSGDTMVELGATTAQVNLKKSTDLTINTTYGSCRNSKPTARVAETVAVNEQCHQVRTAGCTTPPRPFEHITVQYTGPDGKTVYHDVVTDANGCYEDFLVNPQGGAWSAKAEYPGNDCAATTQTPGRTVQVPGGTPPTGKRNLWYSFHLGMGFPSGGRFNKQFDPGPSITIDAERPLTDTIDAVIMAGFHIFHGQPSATNAQITNVSVNAKRYFALPGLRTFLQAGPGVYLQKGGPTKFGFNVGAGFSFTLLSNLRFELGPDWHVVDPSGARFVFLDAKMGVVFRF